MNEVELFLQKCRDLGYNLSGSVFKVDYNGSTYNVGFWISPARYNRDTEEYDLPGICFKVRNQNFKEAIKSLIEQAETKLVSK